jgi:hypothetical protein
VLCFLTLVTRLLTSHHLLPYLCRSFCACFGVLQPFFVILGFVYVRDGICANLWIFEPFAAGVGPLQQPPAVQPQEEVVQGMIWWAFASFDTTLLPSLLLLCRYAQPLCSTTLH